MKQAGSILLRLAAFATAAAALPGQATNDEARLTVGVSAGMIGGTGLWSVGNQPLPGLEGLTDYISVQRSLRSNIMVTGQITYFPRPTLGWTGELTYLGLGTRDRCQLEDWSGYEANFLACSALDGFDRAASGVAGMGGIVVRPSPRASLQPYLKAIAGLAIVPRSTTALTATWGRYAEYMYPIYLEDGSRAIKPTGALSLGISTSPNSGYQFRAELRATMIQLQVVDDITSGPSVAPPISSAWKVLPSLTVGMDIVLEKRRGRRY